MTDDLGRWNVHDYSLAYQKRELSAREAVIQAFSRIEATNPQVNAIVDVLAEEALEAAARADKVLAAGQTLGPLHGIPITIKINVDYAGLSTTQGVPEYGTRLASKDSPVVENLRRSGAIIVGRTNAAALTFGLFTDNALHGPTLNPWNAELTPGGSSGGAAVSVSAGMVPVAHCNDSGGSIRYPAYCCGVMGMRPTFGRVPAFDATSPNEPSLMLQLINTNGPIARTTVDLAAAINAMSGRHIDDPWSFDAGLLSNVRLPPCKIALVSELPGVKSSCEVVDAVKQAAGWLEDEGYEVNEIAPKTFKEASQLRDRLLFYHIRRDSMSALRALGMPSQVHEAEALIGATPDVTFEEYLDGMARRTTLLRDWSHFLQEYPVILSPTTWRMPMRANAYSNAVSLTADEILEFSPLHISPILGIPALSLPIGVVGGVPVGVHLMGGRFSEQRLLSVGKVIEDACGPLWPPTLTVEA